MRLENVQIHIVMEALFLFHLSQKWKEPPLFSAHYEGLQSKGQFYLLSSIPFPIKQVHTLAHITFVFIKP